MKVDIGISEEHRKEIANSLTGVLSDTYALYLKTHMYHWNVTGPMFDTLHKVFEEHYNEMWAAIDVLAERIRSLGHYAPSSYSAIVEDTGIVEDSGVPEAQIMIQNLVKGHETTVRTIRSAFEVAEKYNDQGTLDVLTQRISFHEKTAWMLRSFL